MNRRRASTFLTAEQRRRVEAAIADAEQRTSAEMIVAIASRSGPYERAEDTAGLLFATLGVAAAWLLWQRLAPPGEWESEPGVAVGLAPILAAFLLWWLIGAALATRFPALAAPFITRHRREAEVRRRGFEAFHLFRVARTAERTGLLIYVSLYERTAWVVGDDAIAAALPEHTWSRACACVASHFSARNPERGLVEAVNLCGGALASRFPRHPDDPAPSMPNTLKFMD